MEHERNDALLAVQVAVEEILALFDAFGAEQLDRFDLIDLARLISVRRAVREGFWNEGI